MCLLLVEAVASGIEKEAEMGMQASEKPRREEEEGFDQMCA